MSVEHDTQRANAVESGHATEQPALRARPVARPRITPPMPGSTAKTPVRSRSHHLRWRERIATLVSGVVPHTSRLAWAAASGESASHLIACASPAEADRKTLRLVDLLFLKADERAAIMNAIEEWALAIEKGDL